jgi:16S rRNA (cytosine967-C5)-methyltransferase
MTVLHQAARGAARAAAAAAVHAVAHQGVSLERALTAQQRRFSVQERDGPLVQELAYGTLRRYWTLERRIAPLWRRQPADLPRALLLVGAYQLMELGMPAHAAVSETVAACDALGQQGAKGFVNAVLRALLRTPPQVVTGDRSDFDHPPWLRARVETAWPEQWRQVLEANNRRAPMSLRVNSRRNSREEYLGILEERNIGADRCNMSDDGIMLSAPMCVDALPGFREGGVSVQDCAAQLAAPILNTRPGDRVADLCAAPGGKAAQILERAPGLSELVAVERDSARIERMRGTFARLGLQATIHLADACDLAAWWDGRPFERVLLDAPCSGTGVIRRHPDIKHLKRESDLESLSKTQAALLRAGFAVLAPAGRLLYVTCSILPEENDSVVKTFLHLEPRARSVPIQLPCATPTETGRQLLPGVHGDVDGFFYALIERSA